ncbi:MAG: hypothetical protein J5732_02875 [Bacteroidaceae bacterium]|nr:hypothetical protein [Bacteroidaceae bacterium]
MRLKHITFTGIDARTDIKALQEIQHQYPIAEFGVLTSYHWYENGNRYLDPQLLYNLQGCKLNLALHVCGSAAHDAAVGLWNKVRKHTLDYLWLFDRVQLNIANRTDNPYRLASSCNLKTEMIIQQHPDDTAIYENSKWMNSDGASVSMLLDASGGLGIDTPLVLYPSKGKIGYAGGINENNVAAKLEYLLSNVHTGSFWIDMESGVRTDDWFDIGKVKHVLAICDEVIRDLHMEAE